jgi:hypothetical protein
VVGAFVLVLTGAACEHAPSGPSTARPGTIRGVVLADWTAGGYARPQALASVERIAALGAGSMAIVVTAYQPDATASLLRTDDPRTPTADAVETALAHARSRGLEVVVKPHVDLETEAWRGTLRPADPDAWFAAYRGFVLPWADVAQRHGSGVFVIGTELAGTLEHEAHWRGLIEEVRARFTGALVYAASWDEAELVPFWDALDYVGVDAYAPVAIRRDPGRLDLLAGWQPWLDRLRRLSHRAGRPVLLTEVGYRSVDGAAMYPYRFGTDDPVDLGEQADLVWALLEAARESEWIAGLWWWNWRADGTEGPEDRGYTPAGKPAEEEFRAAWSAGR